MKIGRKRLSEWLTPIITYEAVYRTAPATTGLLQKHNKEVKSFYLKLHLFSIFLSGLLLLCPCSHLESVKHLSRESREAVKHLAGLYTGPYFAPQVNHCCLFIKGTYVHIKHCKNREKLHKEHLIGCQGVKLFLLKYVTISTVTTAIVTTVPIWVLLLKKNFFTIWFFEFCHNLNYEFCLNLSFWVLSTIFFFSFVAIWVIDFGHNLSFWVCHNLSFWILSQFGALSFVKKIVFDFSHN